MSKRGTRLPDTELLKIRELAAQGMNIKQISKEIGRARETVRKAAAQMGLDVRRRISVTSEMRKQIIELAQSGMTDAEGARRVGVAESTFRAERLDAGIKRRVKETNGVPSTEPYCSQLTGLRRALITGAWV